MSSPFSRRLGGNLAHDADDQRGKFLVRVGNPSEQIRIHGILASVDEFEHLRHDVVGLFDRAGEIVPVSVDEPLEVTVRTSGECQLWCFLDCDRRRRSFLFCLVELLF